MCSRTTSSCEVVGCLLVRSAAPGAAWLMLMIRAPWATAQRMPVARICGDASPSAEILTGINPAD